MQIGGNARRAEAVQRTTPIGYLSRSEGGWLRERSDEAKRLPSTRWACWPSGEEP